MRKCSLPAYNCLIAVIYFEAYFLYFASFVHDNDYSKFKYR